MNDVRLLQTNASLGKHNFSVAKDGKIVKCINNINCFKQASDVGWSCTR